MPGHSVQHSLHRPSPWSSCPPRCSAVSKFAVRHRAGLHRPTVVVLLLSLLAAVGVAWTTHVVVADQEERLLRSRVAELDLFLTTTIDSTASSLSAQGAVLQATGGSRPAYERVAGAQSAATGGRQSFAWLRPTGSGSYTVLASVGSLRVGERISDVRAGAFDRAATMNKPVATP